MLFVNCQFLCRNSASVAVRCRRRHHSPQCHRGNVCLFVCVFAGDTDVVRHTPRDRFRCNSKPLMRALTGNCLLLVAQCGDVTLTTFDDDDKLSSLDATTPTTASDDDVAAARIRAPAFKCSVNNVCNVFRARSNIDRLCECCSLRHRPSPDCTRSSSSCASSMRHVIIITITIALLLSRRQRTPSTTTTPPVHNVLLSTDLFRVAWSDDRTLQSNIVGQTAAAASSSSTTTLSRSRARRSSFGLNISIHLIHRSTCALTRLSSASLAEYRIRNT